MSVRAVVGANQGDEDKGKIVDVLAQDAGIVVRLQGDVNAGHTIINHYDRFVPHLLPLGVFPENITNIIGSGAAFHIPSFVKKPVSIETQGTPAPKILVFNHVQLLMPYHILQDSYEEARPAGRAFDSTKFSITPLYLDKYARIGIQAVEFFDGEVLREKVENIHTIKNTLFVRLYHQELLRAGEIMQTLMEYREAVAPYLVNTGAFLIETLRAGKTALVEDRLGSLEGPGQGIYLVVTSSHMTAAFATVGTALPSYGLKNIVTVTKAYSSVVGAGELVSEILDEIEAEELRECGGDKGEYGAAAGRPCRVGWLDTAVTRYGYRVQGSTEVALMVLSALGYLDEIPVYTGYELDEKVIDYFPVTPLLKRYKPVLTVLPGRKEDTRGITRYEELPENYGRYVEFTGKKVGVSITMVSNGPDRGELIYRKK